MLESSTTTLRSTKYALDFTTSLINESDIADEVWKNKKIYKVLETIMLFYHFKQEYFILQRCINHFLGTIDAIERQSNPGWTRIHLKKS